MFGLSDASGVRLNDALRQEIRVAVCHDIRKRTERSELVCPVGGGRLGPAEHPVEHFTLRVANDR